MPRSWNNLIGIKKDSLKRLFPHSLIKRVPWIHVLAVYVDDACALVRPDLGHVGQVVVPAVNRRRKELKSCSGKLSFMGMMGAII